MPPLWLRFIVSWPEDAMIDRLTRYEMRKFTHSKNGTGTKLNTATWLITPSSRLFVIHALVPVRFNLYQIWSLCFHTFHRSKRRLRREISKSGRLRPNSITLSSWFASWSATC